MAVDLAASLRLLRFDNEAAGANAKRIAYEVSKIFGDGEEEEIPQEAEVW